MARLLFVKLEQTEFPTRPSFFQTYAIPSQVKTFAKVCVKRTKYPLSEYNLAQTLPIF